MAVSSEFQGGTYIVKVVGTFTLDEFVDTILQGFANPQFTDTTPVLVDARESESNLMSEDMRKISQRVLGRRPAAHKGRWATLTAPKPLRFGIARMGALTMESLGVPMEVFTDYEAAMGYLNQ